MRTENPKEDAISEGAKEDPKENLFIQYPKKDPITEDPKRNQSNIDITM